MTGTHLQQLSDNDGPIQPYVEPTPQGWEEEGGVNAPNKGVQQLQRFASAIWRFKWLVLLFLVLGGAGGVMATRFLTPEYEVQAQIMLSADSQNQADAGPQAFRQAGYLDLLVSYTVVDPVVTQLSLFISPRQTSDSTLFRNFALTGSVVPGEYSLRLNGRSFELVLDGARLVQTGTVGDVVGTPVGFEWTPTVESLGSRKLVEFTVRTPRETSGDLIRRLSNPSLRQGSNLLTLRLRGTDAKRTEAALNAWTESFVAVATEYKKLGVSQRSLILDGQLEYASAQLSAAEGALEGFKQRTATLPSESRIPQIAGTEFTSNPTFSAFFQQQSQVESLRRDRAAIVRALSAGRGGQVSVEALLSIPSVNADPAASKLRADLTSALTMETELRVLRQQYTDLDNRVAIPAAALEQLRSAIIPAAARALVEQLEQRSNDLDLQVDAARQDLRGIPSRTIELARLQREVDVADVQYRSLLVQAQEAKIAEATTPPDIKILTPAVAPLRPTKNTGPTLIAGSVAAALALGLFFAILLDLLDKRFRYPQQATDELGLFILGVIPQITKKRRRSTEEATQMVEAFRTIRMNMRYAVDPSRPFAVTISSPGPNDGKSLVSSNLALSFADGGSRVILVDGDIRRGELQETFKVSGKPGLVDYLDGTALLPEVLRSTTHPNLTLMPCGKRQRRAPELLTGPRLTQLVSQLKREYDVVIIDSPPLGAGADAYSLSIAAENLVVVLRSGISDRKMAAAKLRTVETLPIRVLGGVLNGIAMTGAYEYYSYYLDYAANDEEPVKSLPAKAPRAAVVKAAGD